MSDNYLPMEGISWTVQYEATSNSAGRILVRSTGGAGRLTDADGSRPGFYWVYDSNPKSANYNPAYFNRFGRALRAERKLAPEADIPEPPSRKLSYRDL